MSGDRRYRVGGPCLCLDRQLQSPDTYDGDAGAGMTTPGGVDPRRSRVWQRAKIGNNSINEPSRQLTVEHLLRLKTADLPMHSGGIHEHAESIALGCHVLLDKRQQQEFANGERRMAGGNPRIVDLAIHGVVLTV